MANIFGHRDRYSRCDLICWHEGIDIVICCPSLDGIWGNNTGQERVECSAKSVDIRARGGSSSILFWRSIARCPLANNSRRSCWNIFLSEAKSDKHSLVARRWHDNVLWFDIAVNDRWALT